MMLKEHLANGMSSRFRYYLRLARGPSPKVVIKEIFRKIKNNGLNTISKVSANVSGTKITDTEFLRKSWNSSYQFNNLEELEQYFRTRKEPKLFIDSSKREDVVSFVHEHFPDAPSTISAQADKICEHIFDLLGSGPVKVYYGMKARVFERYWHDTQASSEELAAIHYSPFSIYNYKPIDWHIDFKSGYRWNPKNYYKDIKYGSRPGVDIKVPWELSRFQHLPTLGEAYFLSKDEKYVREFVNQVNDWIEHNRPEFGVNWHCTMEVAIRACNWILGWEIFRNSKVINQQFLFIFLKSLYQHGCHIMKNLEKSEALTSNHYLSDITGLVYLGVIFPEFKNAKKWQEFGIKELIKEMEKQVYSDGCDFEASTCYHRLVLELFFFSTLLLVTNDNDFKGDNYRETAEKIFGKEYTDKLYKMFSVVLYLLKPNGRMPQIGDNDNGRFHIFKNREVLDMRYLLAYGAIFFKEPKFKVKEFGFCEEALWVFGEKGYKSWQDLEGGCLANIGSRAFPDAGWYIMRSNKNYMIISSGSNGQNGNGGHCHNDKLSFELCIDGGDIIVDPGTYVYTPKPEWRNEFRSTAYHNTVIVDDKEQNRFSEKNLFKMENDAITKCLKWEIGDEIDVFTGEHCAYKRFSRPVVHQREIRFYHKEEKLEIIDRFQGEGEHSLKWNFVLSPGFKSNLKIDSSKLEWQQEPVFYSPEYGTITKTEKLTSTLRTTIPVEVKFWLKIQEK